MDNAQKRLIRFAATLVAYGLLLALALWILWQVRRIWPPLFVAFVLAIALAPIVDRLQARGWPRWLATTSVYLGLFSALGALLFVFVPIVSEQVAQIAVDLRVRFRLDQPSDLPRKMAEEIRIFGRRNQIPTFITAPVVQEAKNSAQLLTGALQEFGALLLRIVPDLIWVVLVPIIAFYALIDYHRIFAKALLLVARHQRDDVRSIADDVALVFGKYLRGLGIVCVLNGLATTLVLLLFEPTRTYAAALGLIAGVLYTVPFLGAIVSTSLISLVALVSPDGGSFAKMVFVTAAMVGLHQLLFDQVIAPRILGGQVGLHPILSIMALMSGESLAGIGGMLLAVPVAASVQVVVLHLIPRLGKRIDVRMQEGMGETSDALAPEKQETLVVAAGEGVIGTPHHAGGTGSD